MGRGEPGTPRLARRGEWYYARWTDPETGTTKQAALRTQDRESAKQALRDFKTTVAGDDDTVGSIMAAYIEDRSSVPERGARIQFSWNKLSSHFAHLRPDQVNRKACRAYTAYRQEQGVSNGTIRTELMYLKAGLRFNDRLTPAIVEMPPAGAPRTNSITVDQFKQLMAATTHYHLRLYMYLAVATAGRPSSILELTWDRVDFQRNLIRLGDGTERIKGRATVPMLPQTREVLLEAKDRALTDYVIEWGGGPIKKVKHGFRKAAKKAGLPDWAGGPYILRHSVGVWMAEGKKPMSEIAKFFGHSSTKITEKHYAVYSPDYLRDTASVIP